MPRCSPFRILATPSPPNTSRAAVGRLARARAGRGRGFYRISRAATRRVAIANAISRVGSERRSSAWVWFHLGLFHLGLASPPATSASSEASKGRLENFCLSLAGGFVPRVNLYV